MEVAIDCRRHRTIGITSQKAKIIQKVNNERLKKKVVETVYMVQFGFKKGLESSNATFMVKRVVKLAIEKHKDLYLCFVDYEKAFETVRHDQMMEKLDTLGKDQANLCWRQT